MALNSEVPAAGPTSRHQRYIEARRITVIGGVIDLALGVAKIIVGKIAYSQSLIADGVHSLSDLATDFMVVWAAKQASRGPDAEHPYGHQRIETVTTIVLGIMLIAVALGIAYDATYTVLEHAAVVTPGVLALWVAAVSVFSKEAIYRYTMRVARRLQSDMLRSNAWHSRSDAMSSIVVIIGVGGSMLGMTYLDAVAAVIVAAMIIWVGGKMVYDGIAELIDTGVSKETRQAIMQAARDVEGVVDIHDLRTRRMGSEIFLDGHLLVSPKLSVSEGHRIAEAVREELNSRFDNLSDITIHVDAEDDKAYQRSAHLPLRGAVTEMLRQCWGQMPEFELLQQLTLHYYDGQVQVEVWLPLSEFADLGEARRAAERLRSAADALPEVRGVDILFR